ncbi:FAD-containing monooxygenase EthA [Aeromicrobium sp. PE09-221]|uniref:flavin-containing monooxygenase n=1 Tax=Aeromicrobium sp. PE09-221 TaxID=1898043 RepID=UPI000B3E9E74|nr:NAD(P)/FAD-dependent oxidoreductase [Aeromicrobium sp. PE09-221]OUZ10288.1 FAD-containing monooxygenase EthA [Aeromicrobium sp. PE09-221]
MGDTTLNVEVDELDFIIVGAGLSGIGIAATLQRERPGTRFVMLEARDAIGGTWDLFKYPGIRSDSDLYTFAYDFKPWTDKRAIAPASAILSYLRETVAEYDLAPTIRYNHKVIRAVWTSEDGCWEVTAQHGEETVLLRTKWLFCASGYYNYDAGYSPEFPGAASFNGQIIHPQAWPDDLQYAGKRVVVIGSGATAVTLVPAMAPLAGHVTMLQRTPSYILPVPGGDPIANGLRRVLGPKRGHAIARQKNVAQARGIFNVSQRHPSIVRKAIRKLTESKLPKGYPVDAHFNPPYNPWDQRLCLVPDGDLFTAISEGSASIVTDRIKTFTADGLLLESGEELPADIVVTATGLDLLALGGMDLVIDGEPLVLTEAVAFKGMLMSGAPNFAFAIGYTNISWTLKVGLVAEHLVRILDYMDVHGYDVVAPELPGGEFATRPLMDFDAGYVQRAIDRLPRQGADAPWVMPQDYRKDTKLLRHGPVTDPQLHYRRVPVKVAP